MVENQAGQLRHEVIRLLGENPAGVSKKLLTRQLCGDSRNLRSLLYYVLRQLERAGQLATTKTAIVAVQPAFDDLVQQLVIDALHRSRVNHLQVVLKLEPQPISPQARSRARIYSMDRRRK